MSFFILYLLIHGPIMAISLGSFSGGALIFLTAISLIYFIGVCIATDCSHRASITEMLEEGAHKTFVKWLKRVFVSLLIIFCVCKAVPDQKSLAIIVGGGITYEVITSDAGKRIGSAAANALENKINEILAKPEPQAPKVKAEGKEA